MIYRFHEAPDILVLRILQPLVRNMSLLSTYKIAGHVPSKMQDEPSRCSENMEPQRALQHDVLRRLGPCRTARMLWLRLWVLA